MFQNEHWWNLIFFLAWHVVESLLHKEKSSLIVSAKKLTCIGEKSVPQTACLLSEVEKYTAELSFGSSRNTLSRRAQMSTEICTELFTRRRIKRRDRRRSFSISLNFNQTILESSQQTRFMFDILKKLLLINALTFIPGEKQDDPLRIAFDLHKFRRIPKAVTLLITAKQKVQVQSMTCNVALLHNSVSNNIVSLCCV